MSKMTPLGGKVILRRHKAREKSAGGIVLPDAAKEKPQEGTIISLGQGKMLEDGSRLEFQVRKGDRVVFRSYGGSEVTHEGEDYVILDEEDILAVVEG